MYLCCILSSNPCLCCRTHYLVLHNSPTNTNLTAICDVSLLPSNPSVLRQCIYPHQYRQRIDQLFVRSPPYWNKYPYWTSIS